MPYFRRRKVVNTLLAVALLSNLAFGAATRAANEVKVSSTDAVSATDNATEKTGKADVQTDTSNAMEKTTSTETQNTGNAETSSAESEKKPLFMWKGTRGKQTVYLLGTIHIVRSDFYPISDEIEKAFLQSKELFVECIPDREKIIKVSKTLKGEHAYKPGDNLYKHLSPETRRIFEEYLQWSGEPMEIYETYRPFEVAGLIESDASRRYGLKVPGLDRYFIAKAKQANKKVAELESVEFQLNLLSDLSEPEQDAELLSGLLELKDATVTLEQMMSAWKRGKPDDLERIETRTAKSDPQLEAVYNKIIIARNHGMVDKLEEYLKQDGDGTYLLAVGAGHLVGDYGLPTLLKEKGFSVSQVSAAKELPKTEFGSAKLQRLYYPEGRFSFLLPGPPATQYGYQNGLRVVEYVYPTFAGAYTVGYIIMPGTISSLSELNSFYNLIGLGLVQHLSEKLSKIVAAKAPAEKTANRKTTAKSNSKGASQIKLGAVTQNSINLCGRLGRQMQLELCDAHGELCLVRVRMVVVDRFLYILTAAGKKVWVNSPIVNEVLNSLIVYSATPHPTGSTHTTIPNRTRR